MHSKEWPLVLFTVLTQMAVGMFLVAEAVWRLGTRHYSHELVDTVATPPLILVVPLLIAGGLVATAHLTRPGRALWVITNLKSSWLSREMLFSVLFGLTISGYVFMRTFEVGSGTLQDGLAIGAILSGVTLIYGMSRLYMLRTVPAWNTAATPLVFFQTALLLGVLGVSATLAISGGCSSEADTQCTLIKDALGWTVPAATVLAGCQLAVIALFSTMHFNSSQHPWLLSLRLVLAILSMCLLLMFILDDNLPTNHCASPRSLLIAALVAAVLAEGLGRYLFYAQYQRLGL